MTQEKSNKRTYIIIIILLLLINLIGGYFLIKKNKESTILNTEKSELRVEFDDLLADMDEAKSSLDTLRGKNYVMDSLLSVRQVKLDSLSKVLKVMLQRGNLTKNQLKDAQAMIARLKSENTYYVTRIDSLNRENKVLIAAKMSLEKDLESEKEISSQLTKDKNKLASKVELGSLLQASSLNASGVKFKSSGKEITSNRVKRIDQLKVCFETGDNKIIDAGPVALLMRIVSPQGSTIAVQSMGSGVFRNKENGEDMQYTKELVFDYENKNKKVCAYWSQNIFNAGEYTAQIYQNGYLIGEKKFELK